MTKEEILAMRPGRELDKFIFQNVFYKGFEMNENTKYVFDRANEWCLQYSTNISAAWEVVNHMNDCLHLRQHGEQGEWEAYFCGVNDTQEKAHGATAPEAIVKAALLAGR